MTKSLTCRKDDLFAGPDLLHLAIVINQDSGSHGPVEDYFVNLPSYQMG